MRLGGATPPSSPRISLFQESRPQRKKAGPREMMAHAPVGTAPSSRRRGRPPPSSRTVRGDLGQGLEAGRHRAGGHPSDGRPRRVARVRDGRAREDLPAGAREAACEADPASAVWDQSRARRVGEFARCRSRACKESTHCGLHDPEETAIDTRSGPGQVPTITEPLAISIKEQLGKTMKPQEMAGQTALSEWGSKRAARGLHERFGSP